MILRVSAVLFSFILVSYSLSSIFHQFVFHGVVCRGCFFCCCFFVIVACVFAAVDIKLLSFAASFLLLINLNSVLICFSNLFFTNTLIFLSMFFSLFSTYCICFTLPILLFIWNLVYLWFLWYSYCTPSVRLCGCWTFSIYS